MRRRPAPALIEAGRFVGEDRLIAKKAIDEWEAAAVLKLMQGSERSGPSGLTVRPRAC